MLLFAAQFVVSSSFKQAMEEANEVAANRMATGYADLVWVLMAQIGIIEQHGADITAYGFIFEDHM